MRTRTSIRVNIGRENKYVHIPSL